MPRQTYVQARPAQKCSVRTVITGGQQLYGIHSQRKNKNQVNFHSLIKGQESERSRLAKELHDGLGSLLSSVKYSLQKLEADISCCTISKEK